jgi:exodeoxyribonuclease VII large subunit
MNDTQTPQIFSVSEISLRLKRTVETTYGQIKVRGEISGYKRHTSGHSYFTLKDQEAVLDAVSWRGMMGQSAVQLQDGLEVIASGKLTTYPGRSKYQMIVEAVELAGQGALLKLLEDLKVKLTAEGLFNAERKKRIPFIPRTIGVVTSPTGAVIRDILHRLSDRFPCHVIVWPVLVQGQGAAEQIAAAIEGFNAMPSPPDTLIVARGGGSLEDLWCFNEEIVVRAAANSRIPLISAVGHETDTTLIDYASDCRAPTPTAAAEMAVPVLRDILMHLSDRSRRLTESMLQGLEHRQLAIVSAGRGLPDPHQIIGDKAQRLDEWAERLTQSGQSHLETLSLRLQTFTHRLRHPREALTQAEQQYNFVAKHFSLIAKQHWEGIEQRFDQLSGRLMQASFQKVLERGFCMVTGPENKAITSSKQVKPGVVFALNFHDGAVPVTHAHGRSPSVRGSKTPPPEQGRLFD